MCAGVRFFYQQSTRINQNRSSSTSTEPKEEKKKKTSANRSILRHFIEYFDSPYHIRFCTKVCVGGCLTPITDMETLLLYS